MPLTGGIEICRPSDCIEVCVYIGKQYITIISLHASRQRYPSTFKPTTSHYEWIKRTYFHLSVYGKIVPYSAYHETLLLKKNQFHFCIRTTRFWNHPALTAGFQQNSLEVKLEINIAIWVILLDMKLHNVYLFLHLQLEPKSIKRHI